MFIGCVSSELSVASLALSLVGFILSGIAIWVSYVTNKRYTSGIVPVVFTVLNPMFLEKVANTLSKVSCDECPGNQEIKLFVSDRNNEYGEVWQVFFNLNILSELILDDALPKKINVCARNSIKDYLSRHQVRIFVKKHKAMLEALYKIGELKD